MEKSSKYVVTLGRQFGCGAREIGQLVAKMLGIEYYDKRLLLEAAKASGVAPAIFEASDEKTPKFFSSLWSFNLGYYSGALFVGDQLVKEDNVYQAQSQVMVELAKQAKVPVAINLDHGASFDQVIQCIQAGFTSVMIDAVIAAFSFAASECVIDFGMMTCNLLTLAVVAVHSGSAFIAVPVFTVSYTPVCSC